MSLKPGERLGPYAIGDLIGKGGMGEVYLATDTRLDRRVAIKISKREFSDRFEREARAISSLNHPQICTLYDVGPNYLVMEFVEGELLSKLLERGPLPLDKALQYAAQIADALAAAHAKGIIHRDLKPGNIMISRNGAKVLDFGLAKLGAVRPSSGPEATGESLTEPFTHPGAVLGTLYYMSPEQVEGKEADEHSDIFSFGVVLYEMIAGQRAFTGDTQAAVLASILRDQPPPMSHRQPNVPRALERVVRKCLEKNPDDRWHSARDLKPTLELIDLDAPPMTSTSSSVQIPAVSPARKKWLIPVMIVAALVAAVGLAWMFWPKPAPVERATKFQLQLPENVIFNEYLSVSPDGHRIVFTAVGQQSGLWVHDLDSLTWRHLTETEGARSPFWSPDSRFLAYGVNNELKKIDVTGGSPQTITAIEKGVQVGSGAWGRDGVILFGTIALPGRLWRVPASGGTAVKITDPAGLDSFPSFLADGKHFLYFHADGERFGSYIGSLDLQPAEQLKERVVDSRYGVRYVDGNAFFVREGTLFVQQLDEKNLRLSGEAVPLAEHIGVLNSSAEFSVSPAGVLAYRVVGGSDARQLTWFDRNGKLTGTVGDVQPSFGPRLSPDSNKVGYRDAGSLSAGNIWVLDAARGVRTRLTFHPSVGFSPIWTADGSRFAFSSPNLDTLLEKAASGAGDEKELYKHPNTRMVPTSYSHDGRFLLYNTFLGTTPEDLWLLPLDGSGMPAKLLGTEFPELNAVFSPDGRWIVYASSESGRGEWYVRSFDPAGLKLGDGKWQISRDGSSQGLPKWRADGKELFFPGSQGSIMSVEVSGSGNDFQAGTPKQLFSLPPGAVDWDVTADGKRVLVAVDSNRFGGVPITVVLNWKATLKK